MYIYIYIYIYIYFFLSRDLERYIFPKKTLRAGEKSPKTT